MKIGIPACLALLAAALSGCESMNQMASNDIQLDVTPMTAACEAYQNGNMVGRYDSGRKSIAVPRSPGSTDIFCYADGYKDKRITMVPDSPKLLGALLTDFGPVDMAAYPGRLQIVMEAADRQGLPR